MHIALDTNRYTDLQRGDPGVVHHVRHAAGIYLPVIVLGELRAGFHGGSRAAANEQTLSTFLGLPGVTVLAADEATSHHYAGVIDQLHRQGTPIPANDVWIAALVLQHGLTLYARDAHFDRLPQIPKL
jgi:predicted nucleic acid-binding protein